MDGQRSYIIQEMAGRDFGDWTSSAKIYRRRPLRKLALVACGLVLILVGLGAFLLELRGPEASGNPAESAKLRLTVPEMSRVEGVPVFTAAAGNEAALRRGVARLAGTGLPWQQGANVYLSGHRLGYPGTGSFLIFRDLNSLQKGDEVRLSDAEGRIYSYRVFDKRVVKPGRLSVTRPVEGKSIVSLQTCTLPDYRKRLVVRAELTETYQA